MRWIDKLFCARFGVRAEEIHFRRRQGARPGDRRKRGIQRLEELFDTQVNLMFSQ